ncbi:MAG TPA: lysophospholipid acyltransferase family protein [Steroidobacteraceae bacterium]|nr:lysophospholipid acyltransferase family protein [Steroidobacteraceae bacterium]
MSSPERAAGSRPLKIFADYLVTYAMVIMLGLICLVFSLWALIAYPLLPRRWGIAAGRAGIMAGFRLYSWLLTFTGAYRLDLTGIDSLRGGPPVILAPNHPSLIDALLILSRHPDLACVMKAALMRNLFLGAGSRLARYIPSDHPRQMIREAVADLRRGGVLLLFPEGTRTTHDPVNTLKASVAVIAKHARVPVQVAIIETDSPYAGKGWGMFRRPVLPITYRIRLGRRFDPPEDVTAFMSALEREYAQQLTGALQSDWLGHERGSQADSYGR